MAIQYSDNEFVKLYRKLLNWEWYSDVNTKALFIHLLLKANWKDGNWKGIEYKRGQVIGAIDTLATEIGITPDELRTAIKHLKKTGEITYKKVAKGGLFTVVNYDQYQKVPTKIPRKTNEDSHGNSQTHPTDLPEDSKQYKNSKEPYKNHKEEKEKKTAGAENPFGWVVE